MKIYIAHAGAFDYESKLYEPLRRSELAQHHQFIFPHAGEMQNSKEFIKSCDLVVAEVSLPSTGEGIELGWANAVGVPVVCMCQQGSKVSNSLIYIAKELIEYSTADDMVAKLTGFLHK